MACSGCQKRRKDAEEAARAVRNGDFRRAQDHARSFRDSAAADANDALTRIQSHFARAFRRQWGQ